jgi:hypothetical protein
VPPPRYERFKPRLHARRGRRVRASDGDAPAPSGDARQIAHAAVQRPGGGWPLDGVLERGVEARVAVQR